MNVSYESFYWFLAVTCYYIDKYGSLNMKPLATKDSDISWESKTQNVREITLDTDNV